MLRAKYFLNTYKHCFGISFSIETSSFYFIFSFFRMCKFECSISKVGQNGGEIQHPFYDLVGCVPSSFITTVMGNSQRNRGISFGRIFITNQSIIYF